MCSLSWKANMMVTAARVVLLIYHVRSRLSTKTRPTISSTVKLSNSCKRRHSTKARDLLHRGCRSCVRGKRPRVRFPFSILTSEHAIFDLGSRRPYSDIHHRLWRTAQPAALAQSVSSWHAIRRRCEIWLACLRDCTEVKRDSRLAVQLSFRPTFLL